MKAIIVTMGGSIELPLEDLKEFLTVTGYTEDLTEERKNGVLCHREELDNQPIFRGFCGPMWDGGQLRYETWEVYDLLSQ